MNSVYATILNTKLMQDRQSRLGPADEPLISQLLLYGVLNAQTLTLEDIVGNRVQVGVLQHYRQRDIIVEEGGNEKYEMWAYPDGIKIYDNRLKVINDPEPEESFGPEHKVSVYSSEIIQGHVTERPGDFLYSFVHTNYGLDRTYFTALCWHEKKYCALSKEKLDALQNRNIYAQRLPKCTLWELQNDPLMIDCNRQLVYVPKVIIVASKYPLFVFQREVLKFYYRNVLVETSDLLISQEKSTYFRDLVHLLGYPAAERHFDGDQTSKMAATRSSKHRQVRKEQLKQFYTSFFFLPKLQKGVNMIELVDCWNSSIKFTPVRFHQNRCFYAPNLNALAVIRKVGVQNLIQLWKCALLQRQILIFSMNNLSVVQLCETLLYLLQPVRWQSIYIPFLPFHLVNNVDAIHGYLIGMSRIHMDYIIQHFPMNQRVIYDLDENVIIENGGKSQVDLPGQVHELITNRLACLGFRRKEKLLFAYLFREYAEPSIQSEEERLFRVKQVFFDGLLYLLNNYRTFAKLDEGGLLQFDRQGYRAMFQDQQWAIFAGELTKTMVFVRLCEYHLYQQKKLRWNQYTMGGLFVYCQNILAGKHQQRQLWKFPNPEKGQWDKLVLPYHEYFDYVLKADLQKLGEQKKVYLIQHYLIKYLSYLELSKDNGQAVERDRGPARSGFKKMLISFFFPWIREIQEDCRNEGRRANNRNSLRLSLQNLPQLECLFGSMSREPRQPNSRPNIQRLLKELKTKQPSYVNYKLLSKGQSQRDRASV